MIEIILGVIAVLAALGFVYRIGVHRGLHKYSSKLMEEAYAGTIIIDLTSAESETFTFDFDKNPKELMGLNYIIADVKIRQ